MKYNKTYSDPSEAYSQYICTVETLTREIIPYETRMVLMDKFKALSDFIDSDKTFKIFILKEGKIDSMYTWRGTDETQ